MSDNNQTLNNPSPRLRFQLSKDNVAKHRDLLASRDFERAIDFALLEYQAQVCLKAEPNPNGALAGFFRILGAQEFVQQLRSLGVIPTLPVPNPDSGNLIHITK